MRAIQSRRFLASGFLTLEKLESFYKQLILNVLVSFACMSKLNVYVELKQRRTLHSFKASLLANNLPDELEIAAYNSIAESDVVGEPYGKPMSRVKKPDSVDSSKISPAAIYQHVRYFKEAPDLGDIYLSAAVKAEVDAAICAARLKNQEEEYSLNLFPWQSKAVQIVSELSDRKVLWIFDKDGGSGKTELLKYFKFKLGFQYLIGASAKALCGMLDINAKGYCIDLMRTTKRNGDVYNLLEQITNGEIQTTRYHGRVAIPSSRIVVVVANYMPNLAGLSLDRWCIFHTKMGEIQLKCEQHGTNGYRCTIAKNMSNTAGQSFQNICDEAIPDSELYRQYLETNSAGLHILYENDLAFPRINTHVHRSTVKRLIDQGDMPVLKNYLSVNKLLDDSIAKATGCNISFVGCTRLQDSSSSESSDSEAEDAERRLL